MGSSCDSTLIRCELKQFGTGIEAAMDSIELNQCGNGRIRCLMKDRLVGLIIPRLIF